jgi:hypothetical protein
MPKKRTIVLMATTMLFAVLVFGGVAYALTIQCDGEGDQDPRLLFCLGTPDSDNITGTTAGEFINTQGGNNRVRALAGADRIFGDQGSDTVFGNAGNDAVDAHGGNDVVHGGRHSDGGTDFGAENLEGAEDNDVVFGDGGVDFIDAAQNDSAGSFDRSYGRAGNDQINAFDGNTDAVNCGDGGADIVYFDRGLDSVSRSCEITHDTAPPNA